MYQVRTITVHEKVPPTTSQTKTKPHAYDEGHYARQSSRFWNVFQIWTKQKWTVEPDEDNPKRWVVWSSQTGDEIAVGNSAFQALESAIQKTKKKINDKNRRPPHGK